MREGKSPLGLEKQTTRTEGSLAETEGRCEKSQGSHGYDLLLIRVNRRFWNLSYSVTFQGSMKN